MSRLQSILFFLLNFPSLLLFAASADLCRGEGMMLSLINRPSFTGSPCTVPVKSLLLESGLIYQNLIDGGNQINGPNLSLRTGFNNNGEILLSAPSYYKQSVYPYSGFSPVWLGVKSRFFYNEHSIFSMQLSISPSSGSASFGSPHTEAIITPIFFKKINEKISYQLQTAVASLCDSSIDGGNCFRTFNPDFVMNYVITKKFNAYIDFYGETKTDYFHGAGMVSGAGLLYLIRPSIVLDMEYYHQVYGQINALGDFFGVGISKIFSF